MPSGVNRKSKMCCLCINYHGFLIYQNIYYSFYFIIIALFVSFLTTSTPLFPILITVPGFSSSARLPSWTSCDHSPCPSLPKGTSLSSIYVREDLGPGLSSPPGPVSGKKPYEQLPPGVRPGLSPSPRREASSFLIRRPGSRQRPGSPGTGS